MIDFRPTNDYEMEMWQCRCGIYHSMNQIGCYRCGQPMHGIVTDAIQAATDTYGDMPVMEPWTCNCGLRHVSVTECPRCGEVF